MKEIGKRLTSILTLYYLVVEVEQFLLYYLYYLVVEVEQLLLYYLYYLDACTCIHRKLLSFISSLRWKHCESPFSLASVVAVRHGLPAERQDSLYTSPVAALHNYTLLQDDSSSQSNEEEGKERSTQDKQIKPKENDKDDDEVCMSVRICMHLHASVCIIDSSALCHHCVGSIARARSLSQVWQQFVTGYQPRGRTRCIRLQSQLCIITHC